MKLEDRAGPALEVRGAELLPPVLNEWTRALLRGRPVAAPEAPAAGWEQWLAFCRAHGITPLLCEWLQALPEECVPPAGVGRSLRDEQRESVALTALRRSQLADLLEAFERAGTEVVVLKGGALSEYLYASPKLRPAADIDLLVRERTYGQAVKCLSEMGYGPRKGDRSGRSRWSNEAEFVALAGGTRAMVDLHWSLSPFPQVMRRVDAESLFERMRLLPGHQHSFAVLEPADALVHAALHLIYANPDNIRLIWLHDIHLLAAQVGEEGLWEEALRLSAGWQARLALAEAIKIAERWWGTPRLEQVDDLQRWAPEPEEWRLFELARSGLSPRMKLHRMRLPGLSLLEKLQYVAGRILPDRKEMLVNYPELERIPAPLAYAGRWLLSLRGRR